MTVTRDEHFQKVYITNVVLAINHNKKLTDKSNPMGRCECSLVTGSISGSHSATFSLKYEASTVNEIFMQI